jgi:hypothetical protein
MTKKIESKERGKTSPFSDTEYASFISPSTGKINEAGYGPGIKMELASLDSKKGLQDIDAGLHSGHSPEKNTNNLEFGDLENRNYRNDNMGFSFGYKENDNFEFSDMNNHDQFKNEYSRELTEQKSINPGDTDNAKNDFTNKDKYQI